MVSSCCAPACGSRTGRPRGHVLLSAFGCVGPRINGGFCREELMSWCEGQGVEYVLGLAKNARLKALIADSREGRMSPAARRPGCSECRYQLESWSRERRVVGKAEHSKGANPRCLARPSRLRSRTHVARGPVLCPGRHGKSDQGTARLLFADRRHRMHANQLPVLFLVRLRADTDLRWPFRAPPWRERNAARFA